MAFLSGCATVPGDEDRIDRLRCAVRLTAGRPVGPQRRSISSAVAALVAMTCSLATPASGHEPRRATPPSFLPAPDSEPRVVAPEPSTLGEVRSGPFSLRPMLTVETAGFAEVNAGFGGRWAVGPVEDSKAYFEHANEIGVDARADLGRFGELHGLLSGVFSMTGGGIDAGASNAADINTQAYTLEDASLSWHSGDLLPGLGRDGVQIGFGNQRYQVFDGLLFWIGGMPGGQRGALWISPRKAFEEAALARVATAGWTLDGFHLKFDDDPDTGTRLGGARVEFARSGSVVESVTVGLCYFNIYESEDRERDGLNGVYAYHALAPLPRLPDLSWTASFVLESNSEVAGLSHAIGYALAPSYRFPSLPGSPQVWYRFASFSGGDTRSFDPLFVGLSDWGSWFQGELLGEFVVSNSNLDSHMVRLELAPTAELRVNLLYYKLLLSDREQSFGPTPKRVSSSALADEVDAILQYAITPWWTATAELTVAIPDDGFREAVGGSKTWLNSMIYTRFHF